MNSGKEFPHVKHTGILVVSRKGVNSDFGSHIGCSGQNVIKRNLIGNAVLKLQAIKYSGIKWVRIPKTTAIIIIIIIIIITIREKCKSNHAH